MSQLVRNVVTTGRKLNEEDGVKVCRRIEVRKSFSGRECCLDSFHTGKDQNKHRRRGTEKRWRAIEKRMGTPGIWMCN